MLHEVVTGADVPRPLGPYSPVVRTGHLLFLSAQTGIDQSTGAVPEGDFEAECRQAFANIEQALRAAGSGLQYVVKTTVFYADLADLPTINKVYADVFPNNPPARSAAIVGLAGGRRISVDAIAVLPG
ncbi:RidA family protein [Planosporangium flavigriseum]|uniref:Reactive intermediate/imine deaminase n=1 Tax=Planosporangium flavigriseum TaxID=373681 RepID=A0A8J3PNY0_9ACTN|nr:Rid family hydrolase [Planosporangium flavigriseum]GIG74456.1 reactive intermediate/imine deaminase [Planosporangium flavigriseum]